MSSDSNDQLIANLQLLQRKLAVRPGPPPLRIHHFMACAVVAAVQLSLLRFMSSQSSQQQTLASGGVYGFAQILDAIGLTLTGFSIYWWHKGYASFSQPGQILLIQSAATFVLRFLGYVLMILLLSMSSTPRNSSWLSFLPMAFSLGSLVFGILLPLVFYMWCAWKIADSWPWRVLFIFCGFTTILMSSITFFVIRYGGFGPSNAQTIVGIPYVLRGVVLLATGILAVVTDLAARRKRSWTHWVGIALWMLGQVGTLLMGLYYLFIWRIK